MANIVRRPRARWDLVDVWNFIADDNETAADGVLDNMDRVLTMLAENPGAGRARPELISNLRSFPVGNYVLFYLPAGDGIELVRVLSGYRDISKDDFAS